MYLNYSKTVLMPLWLSVDDIVTSESARFRTHPMLSLGVLSTWGIRWTQRVTPPLRTNLLTNFTPGCTCGNGLLGAQISLKVYHTFVLPVLSFACQLRLGDERLQQAEEFALREILPGPWGG
jgi:hypothetical protein